MAINYPQRYDDDFLNTIKTVIDHVNVHGKTIQDLVAEGQLTEEQYAQLITVINGLLKSGHVDKSDLTSEFKDEIEGFSEQLAQTAKEASRKRELEDLSENVLAAIEAGEGTSFNLLSIPQDESVTPKKTTYFKKTRNLFEGIYFPWLLLGGSSSARVSKNVVDGKRVAFVEVEPNTTYTIRNHDFDNVNTTRNMRLAESTIHFNDLEFGSNDEATLLSNVAAHFSGDPATFTTRSDTKYLYVEVSENAFEPKFQVEKGEEATEYTPSHVFPVELLEEGRWVDSLSLLLLSVFTSEGEKWGVEE